MQFYVGQMVFSKMGRDVGLCFVVLGLEGDFAYITDGKLRKIAKPKKKKLKHLQPTKHIDFNLKYAIENKKFIKDSDIRESIKKYRGEPSSQKP